MNSVSLNKMELGTSLSRAVAEEQMLQPVLVFIDLHYFKALRSILL